MSHPAHAAVLTARTLQERLADFVTTFAGSMAFVYIHAVWFGVWVLSGVEAFPYGLLTMLVSLEAIFLSTFVMISQNRQAILQSAQVEQDHRLLQAVATHLGVEC